MYEVVTIESPIHGPHHWQRIGERDHERHGAKPLRLAVWRGICGICGETFEVSTPAHRTLNPRWFSFITCPEHRLTPKERGRLRQGPDARRRAAFEKIKREKLAADAMGARLVPALPSEALPRSGTMR